MTISPDEAVDMLRKWANESNPVSVGLVAGGMFVTFSGFISFPLPNAVVVTHIDQRTREIIASMMIGLEMIHTFEYGDMREVPEQLRSATIDKITSALTLKSSGAQCVVFELVV